MNWMNRSRRNHQRREQADWEVVENGAATEKPGSDGIPQLVHSGLARQIRCRQERASGPDDCESPSRRSPMRNHPILLD